MLDGYTLVNNESFWGRSLGVICLICPYVVDERFGCLSAMHKVLDPRLFPAVSKISTPSSRAALVYPILILISDLSLDILTNREG